MARVYGDLGATYGAHANQLYGSLFDLDIPPTSALVALFVRVQRQQVGASIDVENVRAQIGSNSVDVVIN